MIYRVVSIGPAGVERTELLTNHRPSALMVRDHLTATRRGTEYIGVNEEGCEAWIEWPE